MTAYKLASTIDLETTRSWYLQMTRRTRLSSDSYCYSRTDVLAITYGTPSPIRSRNFHHTAYLWLRQCPSQSSALSVFDSPWLYIGEFNQKRLWRSLTIILSFAWQRQTTTTGKMADPRKARIVSQSLNIFLANHESLLQIKKSLRALLTFLILQSIEFLFENTTFGEILFKFVQVQNVRRSVTRIQSEHVDEYHYLQTARNGNKM